MFFNSKGLSVIELLIALSLLGIVLALGFSYFFFGANTFKVGETQSNLQRDIRLTSDFITREVRNAIDLALFDSNSGIPTGGDGNNYIYLNESIIMHIDTGGNVTSRTDNFIESLSFDIKEVNDRYLLEFVIHGSDDDQEYRLESEVYLNNITEQGSATKNGVDPMIVLRFTNP